MHYREATLGDVPRVTELAIAGLGDGPLYSYVFPKRHEFPQDFYDFMYRRMRNYIIQPYCTVQVAEEENVGVVGLAVWRLFSKSPATGSLAKSSYLQQAERRVVETLDWLSSRYQQKNRAIDESRYSEWGQASRKEIRELWSDDDAEHWHLFMFVTDAAWQRRGVGTALLKWGVEKADKAGLAIGLEATTREGYSLYSKFNFHKIGDTAVGTAVATIMKRHPV